ncbi:hypothetical protein [Natronospora cellulosivora (SeqCode)]
MKKICIIIILVLFFGITDTYTSEDVIQLELDININNISYHYLKWSPNSDKIAIIVNEKLYIIDKYGDLLEVFQRGFSDYGDHLEWMDNNSLVISYNNKIEIIDFILSDNRLFKGYNPDSISYNHNRNELAITEESMIKLLNIDSGELDILLEFYYIYNSFYNKDGSKLFFIADDYFSSFGFTSYMYVFDFNSWTFKRIRDKYDFYDLYFFDKENNKAYFNAGNVWNYGGLRKDIVEIDLDTLELMKYQENMILILDEYKLDINIRDHLIRTDEEKYIYLYISPDYTRVIFIDDKNATILKKL